VNRAVDSFAEVMQTAYLERQGETNGRARRAVLAISRANEVSQAVECSHLLVGVNTPSPLCL